jgi:hypothetical protein
MLVWPNSPWKEIMIKFDHFEALLFYFIIFSHRQHSKLGLWLGAEGGWRVGSKNICPFVQVMRVFRKKFWSFRVCLFSLRIYRIFVLLEVHPLTQPCMIIFTDQITCQKSWSKTLYGMSKWNKKWGSLVFWTCSFIQDLFPDSKMPLTCLFPLPAVLQSPKVLFLDRNILSPAGW